MYNVHVPESKWQSWAHLMMMPFRGVKDPKAKRSLDAAPYDAQKLDSYLRVYEDLFESLVDRNIVLLELGVDGGGSLKLWRDYFTNAIVVGVDHKPVSVDDDSGRIRIYQGSQQDTSFLDRVADEVAPDGFDVVIDDAAHIGEYSRICFWHLFLNHLKPGGMYVIEDWGTGYWDSFPDGKHYEAQAGCDDGDSPQVRFPSHDYGMVGFVKELVDECGTGMAHPDPQHPQHGQLKIDKMMITPNGEQVVLFKKRL